MSEKRIVELESKVAFQEYQLSELSTQIAEQQRQILELEALLKTIIARIKTSAAESSNSGHIFDERPPHY